MPPSVLSATPFPQQHQQAQGSQSCFGGPRSLRELSGYRNRAKVPKGHGGSGPRLFCCIAKGKSSPVPSACCSTQATKQEQPRRSFRLRRTVGKKRDVGGTLYRLRIQLVVFEVLQKLSLTTTLKKSHLSTQNKL